MNPLEGVLGNRCPRCFQGEVFYGLYRMHAECPSCQMKFEREPGYFLGAMVFSYAFGAFSMVPTVILLVFGFRASTLPLIIIPCLQVALLNPFLFKYSRLIWLYLDQNR